MVSWSATQIYDPTTGEMVRQVKSSDIFHLATAGAVTGSAGTVLATAATTANKDLYLTAFVAGAKANSSVYVTAGNSTILPMNILANSYSAAIATKDAPLYKTGGASAVTLQIVATDAGTYTAFLSGNYEPIPSKLETA